MNVTKFDGTWSQFLNYPTIEAYNEGKSVKTPEFLFYMSSISKEQMSLAPVSGSNLESITLGQTLASQGRLVRATIEQGEIHLYPNKAYESKLGKTPTVSWLSNKKEAVNVKERTVCEFEENDIRTQEFYCNFVRTYKIVNEYLQNEKNQQKKSACVIF